MSISKKIVIKPGETVDRTLPMIVTVTYNGKPFGYPMDDLREDDFLWFIKSQLDLGREVHIAPKEHNLTSSS